MKAREDGVMRGVQVLLNDGAAAVGYSPALAPSNTALQTSAHPSHQASSVQDTGSSTQANVPAGPVVNPADLGKASISAEQSKEGDEIEHNTGVPHQSLEDNVETQIDAIEPREKSPLAKWY